MHWLGVLGLIAGSHKNKWVDKLIDGICAIGIALPTFWVSMLLIYFLGYKLNVLPIVGMHTIGQENSMIDYLRHFLMPFIALFLKLSAGCDTLCAFLNDYAVF